MIKSKKVMSAIAAGTLAFAMSTGVVLAASGSSQDDAFNAKLKMLLEAGIITGDQKGNLNLDQNITRAQLAVIMVRAFGLENTAKSPAMTATFSDVAPGSWYSGYIAAAKQLIEVNGYTLGTGNGKFNPNGNVTSAEAIALMSKFLGVDPAPGISDWAAAYVQAAVQLGFLNSLEAKNISKTKPANRETVFSFADSAFGIVKDDDGKTVYDKLKEGVGSSVYNKKESGTAP